jgi:hypothetical protein
MNIEKEMNQEQSEIHKDETSARYPMKKNYQKCITLDEIWDMIFSSYPVDMKNFDTMTENQAYRLIKKFWEKLEKKTY